MNHTVVIYESKYGSTKTYAQWIAEELACPIFERKEFNPKDFEKYEVIIYGGGLYAGGISGIKLMKENWNHLSNKKIILFTCGIADPANPENISSIRTSLQKTLSPEMMARIRLFHLRGRIDYSELNFIHKAMMAMLRRMLLKKDTASLTKEDRQLLAAYGKRTDFINRDTIIPLVKYAASLSDSGR